MPKKEEKLKMKKIILTAMLLFLTGCGIYGQGKTYGYVTTIEDGIFLDKVWIRAELESSQTDCYIIDDNYLKNQLFQMAEQKQIKITVSEEIERIIERKAINKSIESKGNHKEVKDVK